DDRRLGHHPGPDRPVRGGAAPLWARDLAPPAVAPRRAPHGGGRDPGAGSRPTPGAGARRPTGMAAAARRGPLGGRRGLLPYRCERRDPMIARVLGRFARLRLFDVTPAEARRAALIAVLG